MKALVGFVVLWAVGVSGEVVTNWVEAPEEMRVFGGQLYNVGKSVKWWPVIGEVQKVATNSGRILCWELENRRETWGELWGVSKRSERDETTGRMFIVNNFPRIAVTGEKIKATVIATGTTNINGTVYYTYDCGTPYMIPVVSTNKAAAKR